MVKVLSLSKYKRIRPDDLGKKIDFFSYLNRVII